MFDETLRLGLAVQLGQSPFEHIEERIRKALKLMGQPSGARLTDERARDLCVRTGSTAVVTGSIASLGTQYVLGLRAENCGTGDLLDEEQLTAGRKEDVLNVLSQLATKFRTRVGESLATVQKHSTPLPEATTPSIDALKAYSAALNLSLDARIVPLYKRALDIDPNFAIARRATGLRIAMVENGVELRIGPTTASVLSIYDRHTGNLENKPDTWGANYVENAPGLTGGYAAQDRQ